MARTTFAAWEFDRVGELISHSTHPHWAQAQASRERARRNRALLQESHDPPRVGLTHTGVCRSARMGLIGRDGVTKITIHQQGLFPVQRSSDRDFLSALRTLGTPRHDRMMAPLSSRSLHTDSLVCAPRPQLAGLGRANPLDANACVLAATNRVRSPDHFPLPTFVRQSVADLKLHGKDALRRAWQRRASFIGLGASSAACCSAGL